MDGCKMLSIICRVVGHELPAPDLLGLLVLDGLQLGTGGDPVTQTPAVAAALVTNLTVPGKLIILCLETRQERRQPLFSLEQQMLEVGEGGHIDLVVDQGGGLVEGQDVVLLGLYRLEPLELGVALLGG